MVHRLPSCLMLSRLSICWCGCCQSALPHLGDLLVIPRYEEVPKRSGDALSVTTGSGIGYQRILLAVDGSAHSTAAAAAAADLASANGAGVLV